METAFSAVPQIITLDGPAGVGKTSLARAIAAHLGLAYLDTGAMFRTLALRLGMGTACSDLSSLSEDELSRMCAAFTFSLSGTGAASLLSCNGQPIGDEIRTEQVGMLAAQIGAHAAVRDALKRAQQALGQSTSLVVEGRDMGTVVFPQARHKFFLDAAPEVRAVRRQKELAARGQDCDLQELTAQIRERDALDRNRALAPLRPAPDSIVVDTSDLDLEGVLSCILHHITPEKTHP